MDGKSSEVILSLIAGLKASADEGKASSDFWYKGCTERDAEIEKLREEIKLLRQEIEELCDGGQE